MSTKVGIGFSENPNTRDAGIEAAKKALQQKNSKANNLALLFATPKHEPTQLLESVRSIVGTGTRIIGGQGNGVITTDKLGYEGYQVGIAIMSSDSIDIDIISEGNLPGNEYKVGKTLGDQIKTIKNKDLLNLFIFFDIVKDKPTEECRLNTNNPTDFLRGMKNSLGKWPPTTGFCLLGDLQFNPSYQFFDNSVQHNTAMVLLLSGKIQMDTILVHGLKPASSYYTITKVEKNTILEIDDKPALDAVAEIMGVGSESLAEFFIVFGINRGDKFGDYNPENYRNLLPYQIDAPRRGLVTIASDLKKGDQFQIMRRNFEDWDYLEKQCKAILKRVENKKPFLALYLDCIQRASAYSQTDREDVEIVQQIIGSKMPLFGTYTGGEIENMRGDIEFTLFNSILCIFSE